MSREKVMSFDLPDVQLARQYTRILYRLPPITLHEDSMSDGPSAKEKQQRRQAQILRYMRAAHPTDEQDGLRILPMRV
jgi:hypothetical protein